MGIYGALSSAVSGLRAQSHALENISGNIANSQTTGYKRIETDFLDLIPDAPIKRQVPGAVLSQSRSTNDIKGDIKTVSNETFIALNSNGFFIVEPKIGQTDGNAVFSGSNFYTRRGDFEIDKDGRLVNGAGYYLKGLPIDTLTGNVSGSVPEVIQLSNSFLPAQKTNRINYQANLPQLPKTAAYTPTVPHSELMRAADYWGVVPGSTAAGVAGSVTGLDGTDPANTLLIPGESLTLSVGGAPITFNFIAPGPTSGLDIAVDGDLATALADMQAALRAQGEATENATVTLTPGGAVAISLEGNYADALTIGGDAATLLALGLTDGQSDNPDVPPAPPVDTITANQNTLFLSNSISGGAITVYAENGAPVNVQLRWAKVDSIASGGNDEWHLYYMHDSLATGNQGMWTRVDETFRFAGNGSIESPTDAGIDIASLTINNVTIEDVELRFGINGLSQFADVNGTVNVSTLNQNGYGAGEFVSVAINDNGRVVATYSNGERIDMAQVVTAEFNAINQLKRLDGGVYVTTSESGEAIIDLTGRGIIGGALEASNTDISDEFTKLIVTQQAYAAGTRIVSTADEMLREALNMIR